MDKWNVRKIAKKIESWPQITQAKLRNVRAKRTWSLLSIQHKVFYVLNCIMSRISLNLASAVLVYKLSNVQTLVIEPCYTLYSFTLCHTLLIFLLLLFSLLKYFVAKQGKQLFPSKQFLVSKKRRKKIDIQLYFQEKLRYWNSCVAMPFTNRNIIIIIASKYEADSP